MKKKSLLTIAIVAVCLLAVLTGALRLRRHYLPLDGPTCALYEKYKDSPGIKASYLRDYPIDDTLALDALLLEASSDSAWCALLSDFGAPKDLINLYNTQRHLFVDEGVNSIEIFYIDTNDTRKRLPRAEPGSRLVIGSYKEKSMCVFMTEEKSDKEIICLTKIKDLRK